MHLRTLKLTQLFLVKKLMVQYSFSVLMASYNNQSFIKTAIKSVLSQTYQNWELLIIDDCSPDGSNDIVKKYMDDERIRLIKNKRNLGYAGALRTGAYYASNEIFCICDADDKLHENALEVMNEAYDEFPNYGFIYSKMWICDKNLENCKVDNNIGPIIPEKTFLINQRQGISHFKTFKKEVYEKTSGFDLNQKKAVDKDIIYKLEEVTDFKFIDECLYYYREHASGISQGRSIAKSRKYRFYAKLKAYKRRLNTDIPNFSRNEVLIQYLYTITYKLLSFIANFMIRLKISPIFNYLIKNIPSFRLKSELMKIRNKYIDLF